MMLAIDNLPHELLLGRQTENGVTVISIDVQSWLDQWPGMETVIMATRPGENAAYPAATRMDGSCIVWTVNGADTAIAGRGTAEILGLVDGVRKLSQIVRTRIKASTVAATTEPPEGAQPWVDKVLNAADEIKGMTATAETLQPGDAATASYADGKLTLGIPRGLPGAKGDIGNTGPKGDPGSDASVTAENIEGALGYVPVNPTALDAKQNVLKDADKQAITKIGMTSGAAWTAAEQKAARDRMGVDKAYELIEEIVVNESVTQVVRTNMSLAETRIVVEVPVSDSVGSVAIEVYSESTLIGYGYIGNLINKEHIKMAKFTVKRDRGTYVFSTVSTNANSAAQKAGVGILNETASLFPVENAITKISLYSTSNAIPLPIGTKITIEGETA